MDLITPDIGLVFWTTLSFLFLLFLLSKFAWKPIVKIINDRNAFITNSIENAKKSKEKLLQIKEESSAIIREARLEREKIIKEGERIKKEILDSSKEEAQKEAMKIIEKAKESIEKQKNEAIRDIKQSIIAVSLSMSESILKNKLKDEDIDDNLLEQEIKNIRL